jgi:hypothetical protein
MGRAMCSHFSNLWIAANPCIHWVRENTLKAFFSVPIFVIQKCRNKWVGYCVVLCRMESIGVKTALLNR